MRLLEWFHREPWKRPLAVAVSLVGCLALVHANWFHPVVRFGHPAANQIALLLALTLPWLAILPVALLPRPWARVVGLVLLLPPLAYSAFFAPFIAMEIEDTVAHGVDRAFTPIATVPMNGYRVRIFRTDCGATCAYGIVLRQERQLLPGIYLVRQLEGFYPAEDATYRVLGRDSLQVNGRLYALRPLP